MIGMKRCNAAPYRGADEHIFVSYCHRDRIAVFPVIERLARDGYRVWYDEGIDPGSDWPEIIAEHLNGCAACIAFVSENSLNSHNCRREINFALLKKKPFLSVFIEQVKLSPGMELQLSSAQSVFRYALTDGEFFKKLYSAEILNGCKGAPDPSIAVSSPEEFADGEELFSEAEERRGSFSDKWFISGSGESDSSPESSDDKQTRLLGRGARNREKAWLIRLSTNERIPIVSDDFGLGRSESRCRFPILGNDAISRLHAAIYYVDGAYYISDNHSANKTYLNSRELPPAERFRLNDNDRVTLADEEFVFHAERGDKD